MSVKRYILEFDSSFSSKIEKKSKELGFGSSKDYLNEIVRRNVFRRSIGKKESYDDSLGERIGKPRNGSKRRISWAKKVGIWQ
jgi:hypothetical protein